MIKGIKILILLLINTISSVIFAFRLLYYITMAIIYIEERISFNIFEYVLYTCILIVVGATQLFLFFLGKKWKVFVGKTQTVAFVIISTVVWFIESFVFFMFHFSLVMSNF